MTPLFQPNRDIILASRSPRRQELLGRLVPQELIRIVPPQNPDELSFDDLHSQAGITDRLLTIAQDKSEDVRRQLGPEANSHVIIAADTIIVVGSDETGWQALGQPPEPDWQGATRRWFREHYAGKTHLAMTGLHVAAPSAVRSRVVTTEVTFRKDIDNFLDTYIATGEPRGKAGGYAIQGLGSLFVERIEGSFTNVIGLPLRELAEILQESDVIL